MTSQGATELGRRIVAFALLALALTGEGLVLRGTAAAVAIAVYAWPWPKRAPAIWRMEAGPARIGPDLLGFGLGGFFFALPFWVAAAEGPVPHPSAWLCWPMAALSLALLWIGAGNAVFGLRIGPAGLELTTIQQRLALPWSGIRAAEPWRRGLPRSLRLLAGLLAGAHPTAAGAMMLARDSHGILLHQAGGGAVVIPREGFARGHAALMKALSRQGIPVAAPATDEERDG